MGELNQYHITMLVDTVKENAIRSMFLENNWPCLLKVVAKDNVTDIIQSGFIDIFISETADDKENTIDAEKGKEEYIIVKTKHKSAGFRTDEKKLLSDNDNHSDSKPGLGDTSQIRNNGDTDSDYCNDLEDSIKESFENGSKITSNKNNNIKATKKSKFASGKQQKTRRRGNRKERPTSQSKEARDIEEIKKTKFQCPLCELYLSTKASLHRHCQSRHEDEWFEFKCKDCPCMFKKLEELWKHRNEAKHDPPKVNPKFSEKKNLSPEELEKLGHLKCTACGKILPSRRLLRRHYYSDHRECMPGPVCAVCGTEFKTRQELWKHKREMKHNDSLSLLQTYQCEECGKVLTGGFSSFKLHQKFACKEVEEGPQIPCDMCGALFKSKSHVQQHKNRTHIKVPVVCDICGTVGKNKHSLNSHKRRHDAKNKKHICDNCGKAFINKLLLIMHMRTHTKEKPFKCPLCDHRCAIKQNIQKHSLNVHKTQVKCSEIVTISETGLCNLNSFKHNEKPFSGSDGVVQLQGKSNANTSNMENNSNNYNQIESTNDKHAEKDPEPASIQHWQRPSLNENEIFQNNSEKRYPFNTVDVAYDLTLCKQNPGIGVGTDIQKVGDNDGKPVDSLSAVKITSIESYTELTNCRINPFSYAQTSMDSSPYTNTWANSENR